MNSINYMHHTHYNTLYTYVHQNYPCTPTLFQYISDAIYHTIPNNTAP